jgi:hypothetical protein
VGGNGFQEGLAAVTSTRAPGRVPAGSRNAARKLPDLSVMISSPLAGWTGWPLTRTVTATSLTPRPWGFFTLPATLSFSPLLTAAWANEGPSQRSTIKVNIRAAAG